jgi:hypothetical protein
MITWTHEDPSLFTFSGTDLATGTSLVFTLTRVGAGPAFDGLLKKNGASQGTIQFGSLDVARDMFSIVAANI